jgi:predicted DNA-binding transcriptional regulator AlpA
MVYDMEKLKRSSSISDDQLLRIQDVMAITTLSKSCINLWVAQGRFPKPTSLSATVKVWRESNVNGWIESQCADEEAQKHE